MAVSSNSLVRRLLAAGLCLAAGSAVAQPAATDGFTYNGSIRARYEALEGQSRAGYGASDDIYSIRTQLAGQYRTGAWRFFGELYDSRTYGANRGSAIGTGEVNTLEPVQAYVATTIPDVDGQGSKLDIQAGRFTLNLGSRRLVAADDYRNTTNGYTGLHADWRWADGTTATLIYVLPQVRRPDDIASLRANEPVFDLESFDQQLWGGSVTRPGILGGNAQFAYYGFAERDNPKRPTRDRNLHNFDLWLIKDPVVDQFDYEAEGIYQTGTTRTSLAANAPQLDVSAWFVHLDAGYLFPGDMKPRLSFEYDYASGGSGSRYNRFDTLFGMRRADFAPSGIYSQIGRANINSPGIRFEFELPPSIDAFITYRAMWLADRRDSFSTSGVIDPTGASGGFAGHQVDGRVRWWIVPKLLRAEVDAAWLPKSGFLQYAPNAPRTGNTRYISAALSTFF